MRQTSPLVVVVVAAAAMFVMLVPRHPTKAREIANAPPVIAARPAPPPVPPIAPPPDPWPWLVADGFAGMSTATMASQETVERMFDGLRVHRLEPPQLELRDAANDEVATIYFDEKRGAYKVSVVKSGIVTMHGIEVGQPLAAILDLKTRHYCEQISSLLSSAGPVYRAIRCWVGKKPARFRYIAPLPDADGTAAALDLETKDLWSKEEPIPDRGVALDRWIETSGIKIDQILWRNDLEVER